MQQLPYTKTNQMRENCTKKIVHMQDLTKKFFDFIFILI